MKAVAWTFCCALAAGCSGTGRLQSTDSAPVVDPPAQHFGLVGLHRQVGATLALRNDGRAPLAVTGLRLEGPGASEYTLGELDKSRLALEESVPLPLRYHPSKEGQSAAVLVIDTDSRGVPQLRVNLDGQGILAKARLSGTSLDFGKIELQSTRSLPLALTNGSVLPVTVTFATQGADGDQFSARGSLSLAPGESTPVAFAFSPTRIGAHATAVQVGLCEGCDPEPVALSGVGLDSAIVFSPSGILFGAIDVDRGATHSLTATNVSDLPVAVTRFGLAAGSDPSFSVAPNIAPKTLGPGDWLQVTATLAPSHLGLAQSALELDSDSRRWPVHKIPLTGTGGGPELGVTPAAIEYGSHTVGSKTAVNVRVQNNGGSAVDLLLQGVTVAGDASFSAAVPALPFALQAGAFVDIPVLFAPTSPGSFQGTLTIASSDAGAPLVQLPLSGGAQPALPCVVQVTPSRIDFGTVQPGRGAVLGFKVVNVGSDVCAIKDLAVSDDAGGLFSLVGTPAPGVELAPGDSFVREVSFAGAPSGQHQGTVAFALTDPAQPLRQIPLSANVQGSCVDLVPRFLDWGLVRGDCGVSPRSFTVRNVCAAPVNVLSVSIGEGTANDFSVGAAPAMPLVLAPGASFDVSVDYGAKVLGQTIAPLFVATSEVPRPLLLPLLGETWRTGSVRDQFIQQAPGQLDVLFVVDNSESMVEEQPRLRAAIPSFIDALRGAGFDAHLAVTTTGIDPIPGGDCRGGVLGGEAGRLFPVDHSAPRIFDLSAPNVASLLANGTEVGYCHYLEQPMEAARRALSLPLVDSVDDPRTPEPLDGNLGFFRDAAALGIVFVTDEDDHSGEDAAAYAKFFKEKKGAQQPARLRIEAIAPGTSSTCATAAGFPGARFAALVAQAGGEVFDVCQKDYAPALARVAAGGVVAQSAFPLSGVPGANGVTVHVDGASAAGWTLNLGTNAIQFDASSVPPPGAHITVEYSQQCQQ